MSNDDGMIKGVPDAVGTSVATIIATDEFGLSCQMTYTITVIDEVDLIVLNPPKNLEITSGYFFKYQMEKRIFWDFEQQNIVIWATLPGYHYTDPHLPSWLHFDQENFTFTGIPPVTSTQYNFTLDIVGVD